MRSIRALTTAVMIGALLPTLAAAQVDRDRDFKNAWFWGAKVGGLMIADSAANYVQAPTVGVDWLITRSRGGIYMAASQSFFTHHAYIPENVTAPDSGGTRSVEMKNLRRFDVVAMAYPIPHKYLHPYIGAGFSIAQIATATPEGMFASTQEVALTEAYLNEVRTSFTPVFMVGAQARLYYFSIFGQASLSPAQKNFLLYNGRAINVGYEIGLRYNVGSSIDKDY